MRSPTAARPSPGGRRRSVHGSAGWAAGASRSPAWSCSRTSRRSPRIYFWVAALGDGSARRERAAGHRDRRGLHRRDDVGQLARRRDRRADPERAARHPVPRPRDLRRRRALALLQRHGARRRRRSTWEWFNPFGFTDWSGFTEACCWPSSSTGAGTPASPSTRRRRTPSASRARGLLTTVILLVTYVGVTVAAMMYAGLGETGTGSATRRTPTTSSSPSRTGCSARRLAARGRGHDLGGLVDADDDPADRARHARDGRLQGASRSVSPRCTRGTGRRRSRRS